jgi:hypothetical protein
MTQHHEDSYRLRHGTIQGPNVTVTSGREGGREDMERRKSRRRGKRKDLIMMMRKKKTLA